MPAAHGSLRSIQLFADDALGSLEASRGHLRPIADEAFQKISNFVHTHSGPIVVDINGHANKHEQRDDDARLFKEEDLPAWITFTVVFFVLIIFDSKVLHRKEGTFSFRMAMLYTCFWLSCAGCFCFYVYSTRGFLDALDWGTGYILEWMFSVDNLFVFHRIFSVFKTPDDQKHTPLFWGIMGAIFFRMTLFCIEQALMHHVWWMHFLFGIFLVYTGIRTAMSDDDEDSDEPSPIFQRISQWLLYVDVYDTQNKGFFMKVPVDKRTGDCLMSPIASDAPSGEGSPRGSAPPTTERSIIRVSSSCKVEEEFIEWRWRGTRLLLVVVCLEVTDLVFAVDSVSAIVAQIPDLYLSYTACIFAMLGLRAMFFVIDELVRLFSLLQYGVAAILVFIGVKLILRDFVHVPPTTVCIILLSTLGTSIIASVFYEKWKDSRKRPEDAARERMGGAGAPGRGL